MKGVIVMEYNSTKEREVAEAMESGKYKVADLSIFKDFESMKFSDKLFSHIEYTTDLLNEHLSMIMDFKDTTPGIDEYLKAVRAADILDNQHLEKENSFMIGMYYHVDREKSIDILVNHVKEGKEITDKDIFSIHNNLLYGTSSFDEDLVRKTNEKYVGRFVNGERVIDYFPIHYKDVHEAAIKFADIYNARLEGENFDNLFLQPFLIHGLFGALQIFNDGNTRMGRLMQHALLWQLINEKTDFDFELPPVYATKSYYPFRGNYRNLITSLVVDNDEKAWEEWFDFNLKRLEDQIYLNNFNITEVKRKIRK